MGQAGIWATIAFGFYLSGAIALATVAFVLWPRRRRLGIAAPASLTALLLTGAWCIIVAAGSLGAVGAPWGSLAESARNLGWLFVIYRLFESDGRHDTLAPIRPVIVSLGFVELTHLGIDVGLAWLALEGRVMHVVFEFNVLFRLLVTVGGLVLVHNLYVGGSREARGALRWPATGLAVLWAFDLNLYTIAYLSSGWPAELGALRGLAAIALAVFVGLSVAHNRENLRIRPSRAVTFQTFSLLVIGVYLVGMVAVAQWLSYAGGNFARLVELAFLTLASAMALVVLPSRRLRAWLRVVLTKHFFQHRYDYRAEWLRFTRTIGRAGLHAPSLHERVVQAVADITDSASGLLLEPGEGGQMVLAARWQWPTADVPAQALTLEQVSFFEKRGFIVDLDELRGGVDHQGESRAVPRWLIDEHNAWAIVPLLHFDRMVGLVVLGRPQMARKLDWEDFDLLRVVGMQLASYLAEQAGQSALLEASRFDEFNRRMAFVMHDIKNLASQLSLLSRNAERHAENPEFRADMLITLRNSADKLNALLTRLSRYGGAGADRLEDVDASEIIRGIAARYNALDSLQVHVTHDAPCRVMANREALEQVLLHLVQNAIDASTEGMAVFLQSSVDGLYGCIEVIDTGSGMSADFIRTRLFKPFVSTKQGGFGIGAYEARETVRAMRGKLDVESREGLGSRFTVRLPLASAQSLMNSIDAGADPQGKKVA